MPDDLTTIDVTHLDALAKLESDHRALRALSEKAAWRRDKEIEVYSRVVADYGARMATILEQAQTMRRAVSDDFKTLDALYHRHKEALNQARVQLQECEFRHEIGEFTREEFERCQQAAERTIAEREAEFETVGKLRERYLALLPAEPVAVAPAPSPAPAPVPATVPAPPPASPVSAAKPAERVVSAPVSSSPAPLPPSLPPSSPWSSVDATQPMPVAAPARPPVPAAPAPTPAPPVAPTPTVAMPRPAPAPDDDDEPVDEPTMMAGDRTLFMRPPTEAAFKMPQRGHDGDTSSFGTIVVSPAILVEDRGGIPGTTHRLGPITAIGRDPENQIVVPVKEVSRKHAQIAIADGGYVIKDLGSPNGTTVNGKAITEHRLKEGDKITVGGKVFIFKAP